MCQSFIRVIDILWNRDKHKKITLIIENKITATDQLLNVDKQLMWCDLLHYLLVHVIVINQPRHAKAHTLQRLLVLIDIHIKDTPPNTPNIHNYNYFPFPFSQRIYHNCSRWGTVSQTLPKTNCFFLLWFLSLYFSLLVTCNRLSRPSAFKRTLNLLTVIIDEWDFPGQMMFEVHSLMCKGPEEEVILSSTLKCSCTAIGKVWCLQLSSQYKWDKRVMWGGHWAVEVSLVCSESHLSSGSDSS